MFEFGTRPKRDNLDSDLNHGHTLAQVGVGQNDTQIFKILCTTNYHGKQHYYILL